MFNDGFFDFNGDGRMDAAEQFVEYETFRHCVDGDDSEGYRVGGPASGNIAGSGSGQHSVGLSEPNDAAHNNSGRKLARILIIVFIIIAILIAIPTAKNAIPIYKYGHAEDLIAQGQYSQAKEILYDIAPEQYRDTYELYRLCEAHELYDEGYVDDAYYMMMVTAFHYQSDEQMAEINAFIERLTWEHEEITNY